MTRAAHGAIPLPPPAVVEILRGAPVVGVDEPEELVTPTGAAILAAVAHRYGAVPAMELVAQGFGVGSRRSPHRPNLLRLLAGRVVHAPDHETLWVVEANIDDMDPELFDPTIESAFDAGALDVWLAPVQMKKARPGIVLSALCRAAVRAAIEETLVRESSTVGVRAYPTERRSLPREIVEVETAHGRVRVKLTRSGGRVLHAKPEFEDVRRLARSQGLPVRQVYEAACAKVWGRDDWPGGGKPGGDS